MLVSKEGPGDCLVAGDRVGAPGAFERLATGFREASNPKVRWHASLSARQVRFAGRNRGIKR
jgi:hypothetical protein